MTDQTQAAQEARAREVTQADREAAGLMFPTFAPMILAGELDESENVQAFARHREALDASSGGVFAGMKLVPIEPTDEMIFATEPNCRHHTIGRIQRDWSAMLAASPTTPEATAQAEASDMGAALERIAAFSPKPLLGNEGERSATHGWNSAGAWAARIARGALPLTPAVGETDRAKPVMYGGCGETDSAKRCHGCLHDFGTPESAWVSARAPTGDYDGEE